MRKTPYISFLKYTKANDRLKEKKDFAYSFIEPKIFQMFSNLLSIARLQLVVRSLHIS